MAGRSGQLYTGHCVIRLRDNVITERGRRRRRHHSAFRDPVAATTWTPTCTVASRSRWPAASRSTAWAAGSSTASTGDPSNVVGTRTSADPHVVRPRRAVYRRSLGGEPAVGSWCAAACRPQPRPGRLRPPRTAGHRRLAVGQPRPTGPGDRRVRRGRAALRHRPHSRRGEDRLAHRPQRPARSRLHQRRPVRRTDGPQGHRPRRHRRDLRRQEQLVGGVRAVGVHPVRPPRRPAARRRARPVDLRRARHHARRADQADHRVPGRRAR